MSRQTVRPDISTDVTLTHPRGMHKLRNALTLPEYIAGYKLGDLIGSGGQGVVYRGERAYPDASMPEQVAIKCMWADDGDCKNILEEGFRAEVRIFSDIAHPNIVRSYGSGVENSPRVEYILLELCKEDVDSLSVMDSVGRVPVATSIVYDIAAGLRYVHERDILHCDVKPKNILMSDAGEAKLCDFGLASSGSNMLRGAGTPHYMAPEKLREYEDTPASDVYGLGATLWHLITGVAPFEEFGAVKMVQKILHEGLPELSDREAPRDLRELVCRMTSRYPEDRADLDEVQDVCRRYRNRFGTVN